MCWMCDHPDATFTDYVDQVLQPHLDRFGWAVLAVGGSRLHAPFSYTVGLTPLGLPELVVTGRPAGAAAGILDAAARQQLAAGAAPTPGTSVTADRHVLEVVALPHPEAHLFLATGLYGEAAVRGLQLVWADDRGRWPWDRGHRNGRGGQPVLGPRALTGHLSEPSPSLGRSDSGFSGLG